VLALPREMPVDYRDDDGSSFHLNTFNFITPIVLRINELSPLSDSLSDGRSKPADFIITTVEIRNNLAGLEGGGHLRFVTG